MRGILLACVVVATFEQPIGHSVGTNFVMRHEVSWCPQYHEHGGIRVVEKVVNGRTGAQVGPARAEVYPVKAAKPMETPPGLEYGP